MKYAYQKNIELNQRILKWQYRENKGTKNRKQVRGFLMQKLFFVTVALVVTVFTTQFATF